MRLITNLGLDWKFWLENKFPEYKEGEISVYLSKNSGNVIVFPDNSIQYIATKICGSPYALYLNEEAIEDSDFEGNCWDDMNRGFYGYVDYTDCIRNICNVVYPKYMIVKMLKGNGIVLNTQEDIKEALHEFASIAVNLSTSNSMFRPTARQIIEAMGCKSVCWLN